MRTFRTLSKSGTHTMNMTAKLLFPAVAAALLCAASAQAFEAHDDGNDGKYVPEDSWMGINGGSGFSEWTAWTDTTGKPIESSFQDGSHAGTTNWGDFTLSVEGGEVVAGRDLEDAGEKVALKTGSFSVLGWLHPGDDDVFLGFAVYDAAHRELLRWGVLDDGGNRLHGMVYRSGDGDYQSLEEGEPGDGYLAYTLTWDCLTGGLQFTLSAEDAWGEFEWSGQKISVAEASSVGGVAVIAGAKEGSKATLAFDQLSVQGTEVPEPGTLGLLAAGMALLAGRRRG